MRKVQATLLPRRVLASLNRLKQSKLLEAIEDADDLRLDGSRGDRRPNERLLLSGGVRAACAGEADGEVVRAVEEGVDAFPALQIRDALRGKESKRSGERNGKGVQD